MSLSPAVSKRDVIARLFFAAIACLLGIATPSASAGELAFSRPVAPAYARRTLTFAERVGYQYAIEEIYWRHRIWPEDNAGPKPPLDAVISREQIEKKVSDYLRESQALTDQRRSPISASELQAEMDRMAQNTKRPEMLRELFEALGNDPFVIAECLARPILAERLTAGPSVVGGVPPGPTSVPAPDMAASTENGMTATTHADNGRYKLPQIAFLDCTDDSWTTTSTTDAPDGRIDYTAVWTGSEMIVWGGFNFSPPYFLSTGGRYNPTTDTWTATNTSQAPNGRGLHTAVWTGSEMIVWGGAPVLNTGGRYNPISDTWTATSTTNAPVPREQHSAVWSGTEMIIWGGRDNSTWFNSGGRYNPSTDSWTATSTISAPEARWYHNAEWTGTEMIVWGGTNQTIYLKTGAKYNPTNNSWTPTSTANAPLGRVGHTAIWSGNEMMVWGGTDSTFHDTNTGGRYNASADSWSATSTNNAPSPRDSLAAVWTGNEMIVWGGVFCCPLVDFNTGGRYNADTDSWAPTSTASAPLARSAHTAVWTGSEMITWGGFNSELQSFFNTGARYCARSGPAITLDARVHRQGDKRFVALTWSPADGGSVNLLRNGVVIGTANDDGTARDKLGTHTGTFTYQVCETDSGDCSNEVRVRVRQTGD